MIFILLSFFSCLVFANQVKLPPEELSSEAILPVFDLTEAVKGRTIVLKKKMEIGLIGGAALNEPFFSPFNFGGSVSYNFSEQQAAHISFLYWLEGDTTFKQQLEADGFADLTGAPRTEYMLLADYQYAPFYGKMSLTKHRTSNFHLFLLGGGGLISIGGKMNPLLSLGIGQKFYFTRSFALRFDLRGLFYNGPDPLSVTIDATNPTPATEEFAQRFYINLHITASLVFVL